jgi:non-homologous end joining protein Ku
MKAWRNVLLRFGVVAIPVGISPAKSDKPSISAHRFANGERARQAWTIDGESIVETSLLYDVDGAAVEIDAPRVGNDGRVLEGSESDDPSEIVLSAWTESAAIDPLLYDASYCVMAGKGGADGMGLVAKILRDDPSRVLAGVARFTDRPRSVVLRWSEAAGSVVLHTLTYAARVRFEGMRKASESFADPSPELEAQAALFTASLPSAFTPLDSDPLEAAVINALREVCPSAQLAEVPTTAADILATLRADVAEKGAATKGATKGTKSASKGGKPAATRGVVATK